MDSVAPITTREYGNVPDTTWMSRGCKTDLDPHWIQYSEEMALSHTVGRTWESKPYASLRQHNEAGPDCENMGEPYLKAQVWESGPCHSPAIRWPGRRGDALKPCSLPSLGFRKAAYRVMHFGELSLPITSCIIWESRP